MQFSSLSFCLVYIDGDGSNIVIATQLNNIRMQLEEKRRQIETEKRKMEAKASKQREQVGKAAFLQTVTKVSASTPNSLLFN